MSKLNELDENNNFKNELTIPERILRVLKMKECDRSIQIENGLNPDDKSANLYFLNNDPFTLRRHPIPQTTDCIRGRRFYTKGIHLWKVVWESHLRGTHAMIGVATDKAPISCSGYVAIVGNNTESWGWDLICKTASHNKRSIKYPNCFKFDDADLNMPDEFIMCLDMELGTLSFILNGRYCGAAFSGLRNKKLYPIVGTVWGNCKIKFKYIIGFDGNPLRLIDLSSACIREALGEISHEKIKLLNLPLEMQNYLFNF